MTTDDILRQVEADGIETIRVVFTDPHGVLRGKTITAAALNAALKDGIRVPSTLLLKDISHRTAFPIWAADSAPMHGASDLVLRAIPESFRVIPWAPHSSVIQCDVHHRDGAPVAFASRTVLARAEAALAERELTATMGAELEFQIYRVTDPKLDPRHATMPGAPPSVENTTQGYQYLTETRYAEVEDILDQIRRAAEAMGLPVRSIEVEMGPSQYEVTFAPAGPMETADVAVLFRMVAKEVCARAGLLASFMPKPALPNAAANGWHIHQSLTTRDGRPFHQPIDPEHTPEIFGWLAGLLDIAPAACLLTNPTVTSYKRFSDYQLAPNQVGWSMDNRGAMIRGVGGRDNWPERLENRLPDSAANPYFALAAQIHSGLSGLGRRAGMPAPIDNPYDKGGQALPANLGEAIDAFAASDTLREALTAEVHDWLITLKRHEWSRYLSHISDWEQAEYFATL